MEFQLPHLGEPQKNERILVLKHWSWRIIEFWNKIELLVLSSIVLYISFCFKNPEILALCRCRRILKSHPVWQVASSQRPSMDEFGCLRIWWPKVWPVNIYRSLRRGGNHSLPLRIQVNYCQDTDMGSDDHNNYVKGVTTSTQSGDHSQILSNRWFFSENTLSSGTSLILRSLHFELYVISLFFPFNGSHVSCLADMVIAILG